MEEFTEIITTFSVNERIVVKTDKAKTVAEMTVPFIPGKELAVQVSFWARAENEMLPTGKENTEISVYRNTFFRRAWCIWRNEPEGRRTCFHVNPGDKISVIAVNGLKTRLNLMELEFTLYAKDEEGA